jgi:histidine triad (HIT) family protein
LAHQAGCIFCEIVLSRAPSYRVFEDEQVLVFMDLFPVSDGHTLLITKQHYENIFEAPPDELAAVAARSHSVAHAIRQVFAPDGVVAVQLNGAAAGQTVFHYHLHLIPRMQGDPQNLHGRVKGEAAALERNALALQRALRA